MGRLGQDQGNDASDQGHVGRGGRTGAGDRTGQGARSNSRYAGVDAPGTAFFPEPPVADRVDGPAEQAYDDARAPLSDEDHASAASDIYGEYLADLVGGTVEPRYDTAADAGIDGTNGVAHTMGAPEAESMMPTGVASPAHDGSAGDASLPGSLKPGRQVQRKSATRQREEYGGNYDVGAVAANAAVSTAQNARAPSYLVGGKRPTAKAVTFRQRLGVDLPLAHSAPRALPAFAAEKWPKPMKMPVDVMAESPFTKRDRDPEVVSGPEVAQFHRWTTQQNAAVGVVAGVRGDFTALKGKHIRLLNEQHETRDVAHFKATLRQAGRTGQRNAYKPGQTGRALPVLRASSAVHTATTGQQDHLAHLQHYVRVATSLHHSVIGARADIDAYHARERVGAAASKVSQLEARKARIIGAFDVFVDVLSGGLKTAGKLSQKRGTEAGSAAGGVTGAVVSFFLDMVTSDAMTRASATLEAERKALKGHEASALGARLRALDGELSSYRSLCRTLATVSNGHAGTVKAGIKQFWAGAGEGIQHLKPEPGAGATTNVDGNDLDRLQKADAHLLKIAGTLASTQWPELEGKIPLGGYLLQSPMPGAAQRVTDMTVEASKLRWWKTRMGGVRDIRSEILAMMKTAGDE